MPSVQEADRAWKDWLSAQAPVDLEKPHGGGPGWGRWSGVRLGHCKRSDTCVLGPTPPSVPS